MWSEGTIGVPDAKDSLIKKALGIEDISQKD